MIDHEKINWLLNYAIALSARFSSVVANEREDFSEDRIKVFFHRDRFSNFLEGHDQMVVPITFEIWPSLTCDARCPLCTYSVNQARSIADKSTDVYLADTANYKRIIGQFKEAGVHSIILTGGGEPLINPHLSELAEHINNLGMAWGMFTHGMLLNETNIHSLLSSSPRFIRISINAGSAKGHEREYRIGSHTYDLAKKNTILAATISHQYRKSIGLGYAINGKTTSNELSGMFDFVRGVMEQTKGGLASVSFRPKVAYYDPKGNPSPVQPNSEALPFLIEQVDKLVIDPLKKEFSNDLKIDFKKGMFKRLYNKSPLSKSFTTGWTGSIDEKGRAYILSELNGSIWPNVQLGNFSDSSFSTVWHGDKRTEIIAKYISGELLAPVHHKLSHIDETLTEIRNNIGMMTKDEISVFWGLFEKLNLNRPSNWDFL